MLSVDIGIGHNDYLVVTKLVQISLFGVFSQTKTYAQCLNDVVHLVTLKCFMPHGFFHIEYFTSQRKDGLSGPASSLLGRATGGISLDQEQLTFGRVF